MPAGRNANIIYCCFRIFSFSSSFAQTTQIRGFIDGLATYQNGKASFGFLVSRIFSLLPNYTTVFLFLEKVF